MNTQQYGIQSTAGAVPVRNEKGEISMQKVKVHRYVSGKRPDYAHSSSDSEGEDFIGGRRHQSVFLSDAITDSKYDDDESQNDVVQDSRLRRLRIADVRNEVRPDRRRHIVEPEILEASSSSDNEDDDIQTAEIVNLPEQKHTLEAGPDDDESDVELSESEIERRREVIKRRMLEKKELETVLDEVKKEERNADKDDSKSSDSSDYDEYTDSEEDTGPRLKPIFVRKNNRVTIIEKEKAAQRHKQQEHENQRNIEERRRQSLRMVEETIRREQQTKEKSENELNLGEVCTDDENDEIEYSAWKLRELKRIKRDREEREALEKEHTEIERLRNMTEEERRIEARLNPKVTMNKAVKGKYKFLQKYYHRGAFYLDKEDDVFKRDFAQATLEDHFDKTVLPKVMQVKNFGRSGRTKYTHLVDQDTTQFDSPWSSETAQNLKFYTHQAAGSKPVFEKPTLKKRKLQ